MDLDLVRLMSLIGRISPSAWDAIIPHGPAVATAKGEPNPQPSAEDRAQRAAVETANQIAQAAISAEAMGGKGAALVRGLIDDWCGTPWPRLWPWPSPPQPGPEPPLPYDVGSCRVAGALAFASLAARMQEGELRDAFADGSTRLFEAGFSQ